MLRGDVGGDKVKIKMELVVMVILMKVKEEGWWR